MTDKTPILAQTFTESFTVYSAKRFPGVPGVYFFWVSNINLTSLVIATNFLFHFQILPHFQLRLAIRDKSYHW